VRNDITIGGYIPIDSMVHRLDPRTKLAGLVGILVAIFLFPTPSAVTTVSIFVTALAYLTQVGALVWIRACLRFSMMLGIVLGVNVFLRSQGRPIAIGEWDLPITWEGLEAGIIFTVQIILAIVASLVLTFSTSPIELSRGLERLARPLNYLKVPVGDLAMIAMLAIRFVPLLQQELHTTIDAQKSRGVDFGTGKLTTRAANLVALMAPVLTGCLRRADLLATAMTARGFKPGAPRSEYRSLRFCSADWYALGGLVLFLVFRFALFQ
jgi:energy-coupling factor transport system permease protein